MSDDPADDRRSRSEAETDESTGTSGSDGRGGHDETGERADEDASDPESGAGGEETGAASHASAVTDERDQSGAGDGRGDAGTAADPDTETTDRPPEDVRKYERFKKVDGAQYDRVNDFLRERTYITAREWAIARLCADFRTETGVEMTKIGNNLPELVPFMTDTYSPQAVNQARHAFREKVRKSGATFLYGAMCGFFTAEELDELMYEVSEIAKFLLEVEGVDLAVAEELEAEERISTVMREVREASSELRAEDLAESASSD
jgi:hypothetical protein